jgi:Raf kinase inhibitor-like YbhB/YbcL family protein
LKQDEENEMVRNIVVAITLTLLLCSCKEAKQANLNAEGDKQIMDIKITSSAFAEGGMIPAKYTCDGADISPPLQWDAVPEGTKTVALISDDPDAPMGTWVHWVLFNLPPDVKELPENVPPDETLSNGATQGTSSFQKIGYGGPCPPSGTHRYFFKLYALDAELDLDSSANKARLIKAMEGHIIGEGQLIGKYKRQ